MGKPGLMYVRTKLLHPDLAHETFNHWYDDVLTPEVLKASKASAVPGPPVILRYRHLNPSDEAPYAALYPLPDLDWLESEEWKGVPRSSELLPGDGHAETSVESRVRVYEHVHTFEGNLPPKPGRARALIAAANEVPPDFEAELDQWYRRQHLDMMTTMPGYRRSTRYRLVAPGGDGSVAGAGGFEEAPKFLALHEFEAPEHIDESRLEISRRTEWSKLVLSKYVRYERNDWQLIGHGGDAERQLGVY